MNRVTFMRLLENNYFTDYASKEWDRFSEGAKKAKRKVTATGRRKKLPTDRFDTKQGANLLSRRVMNVGQKGSKPAGKTTSKDLLVPIQRGKMARSPENATAGRAASRVLGHEKDKFRNRRLAAVTKRFGGGIAGHFAGAFHGSQLENRLATAGSRHLWDLGKKIAKGIAAAGIVGFGGKKVVSALRGAKPAAAPISKLADTAHKAHEVVKQAAPEVIRRNPHVAHIVGASALAGMGTHALLRKNDKKR